MKVVINKCYGEFSLSPAAKKRLAELNGKECYYAQIHRADINLIKVVEELGEGAGGMYAKLKIVEIPDDIEWEIDDNGGMEMVREIGRAWA